MDLDDGAVEAILSTSNPHEPAQRVLRHLLLQLRASGGAILTAEGDEPVIWVSLNVRRSHLIPAQWKKLLRELSASGIVSRDSATFAQLRHGSNLVGLLYLEGEPALDAERHAGYLSILSRLVVQSTTVRPAVYTVEDILAMRGAQGNDERLRAITLQVIESCEWNLSHAARRLGVTRATLYKRLDRWRISRQRVPKR